MGLSEQTLTPEQMKELKALGVDTTKASVVLIYKDEDGNRVSVMEYVPTLTLQGVIDLLPEEIRFEDQRAFLIIDKSDRQISYTAEDYDGNLNIDCMFFENESLLQAAYNMLCWVAQNGHLSKE